MLDSGDILLSFWFTLYVYVGFYALYWVLSSNPITFKKGLCFFIYIFMCITVLNVYSKFSCKMENEQRISWQSRYLWDVLEHMDVSDASDCDILREQVRYLISKSQAILRYDEEFANLYDLVIGARNKQGEGQP